MEKYLNVMKQVTELTDTMVEGLLHIQQLLGEGKAELAIQLLENVVSAFASVEQSITPIKENIKNHEIEQSTMHVQEALELVIADYEAKNYAKVQEVFQFTLIPRVNKWKESLEKIFKPYIVS